MTTRLLIATAVCLPLLWACNPGESEPVNKAQDMAAAPVGGMSAATVGQTVEGYVTSAAMADMYEIQAADIALERSQTPAVRELATMIKADHTMASERMMGLVPQAAPGVQPPAELDERRQGLIDNLRAASPATFDRTYMDQQVAAHQEALTLHQGFSDNTEAPTLAEHARMVVPKIQMHLDMARADAAAPTAGN